MPSVSNLDPLHAKDFADGAAAFSRPATPADGLGPVFNGYACATCHVNPIGAATNIRVTRFGKNTATSYDALVAKGGPLLHRYSVQGVEVQTIPREANLTAVRRSPHVFGLGLVDAIPDEDIEAVAKAQAQAHPQQAGRVNFVVSPSDGRRHVGRFGWKCQQGVLRDMVADAFANEIGVSNPVFPYKLRPDRAPRPIAADQLDDQPDVHGRRRLDRVTSFVRFLAPLPRTAGDAGGEALFKSVGCAVCHRPSYVARSPIAALNGQTVWMYSDFLLHDVGLGDGLEQNGAPANMLRTAPLSGAARQPFFLHDGSAKTVEEAIERHEGQAKAAREAFAKLSPDDRAALLRFINSL